MSEGHARDQKGLREVEDGLAAWRATASKFQVTFRLVRAAEACLFADAKDDGLKLTDEALDQGSDTWFLPEVYRRVSCYIDLDKTVMLKSVSARR